MNTIFKSLNNPVILLTLKTLLSVLPDFLLIYSIGRMNLTSINCMKYCVPIYFVKPAVISSTEDSLELKVENQVQNEDIILSVAINAEIQDALDLSAAQREVFCTEDVVCARSKEAV